MIRLRRYSMLLLLMLLTCVSASAASVHIQVKAASNKINVGDKFLVIVTTSDVDAPLSGINVPGATSDSFIGSSQSDGIHSRGQYKMMCRALKPGSYTLGPISVGGVRSNAVRYTIVGTAAQSARAMQGPMMSDEDDEEPDPFGAHSSSASNGPKFIGKGNSNLFMRASVSKSTAYEQEALVYTVKLYSTYPRIKFVGATASPKFDGFVVEESKQTDTQLRHENINGRTYVSAVIARYIIFPQMTGSLKVTGNTYTVSVDEAEYYQDQGFGRIVVSRPMQLNVTPNDLNVNVRPLPAPKPADFSGGVGKFSITSSMPSRELRTGETASIVYTVTGAGNLKYITLPDLSLVFPKQISVNTPETDVKTSIGTSSVTGSVRFDYSIMPDEEGEYTIPDITLVYFNPETGRYEKSVAKGYKVKVGKGSGSSRSQKHHKAVFDPKLMDITDLSEPGDAMVHSFLYWLFYIVPVIALVIILICYRKYLKDNADLSSVLSRKAGKMAARRLRKAAACMKSGDVSRFYDEMLSALWGYIGYKMKMPTSELSRENISDVLQSAGVPVKITNNFIDLLDACEFEKYAPGHEQKSSMKPIYDNGVEVINSLEESFKSASHVKKN